MKLLFRVFLFLLFLILPLSIQAITIENVLDTKVSGDLLLEKGKLELTLSPGEVVNEEISIINRSGKKIELHLMVEDIFVDKDSISKLSFLKAGSNSYSLCPFIDLEGGSFFLEHGQKAIIPVVIKIPNDIKAGGLFGALTFVTPILEATDEFDARLSTLVFLTIKENAKSLGRLNSFTVFKKNIFNKSIAFKIDFINEGNVVLTPKGKIKVINIFDGKNKEVFIDGFYVMPESSRSQQYFLSDLSSGFYRAEIKLESLSNDSFVAKTHFVVFSIWLIIVLVLIIIIVLLILFFKFWKLRKKKV